MKKRWKWLVAAVVLIVIVLVVMNRINKKVPGLEEGVKTDIVGVLDIAATLTANGKLEEVNGQDVFLDTPVKVLKVLKEQDDLVKKGEAVLEVDLQDLHSQLAQAIVARDNQALAIERIKLNNQQSTKSLSLAVTQAETALAIDRDQLARAVTDLEKNRALYESGQISKAEYDRYVNTVTDLQNKVKISELSLSSARANLANVQNNQEASSSTEIELAMQENMLQTSEQAVADLEARLARIEAAVLAPMDGVVTVMNAKSGTQMNVAQAAYRVADLTAFQVKAEVKEYDARRIRIGQKVVITGDGIPEGYLVTGTVSAQSSIAYVSRTVAGEETVIGVTITVDPNTDTIDGYALKSGLTVTATITTDERTNAVVILYSMLMQDADGTSWVYLYKDGGVQKQIITTGITADLNIEVTSGLSGGEEVVVNPPKALLDGMKVKKTP